MAEAAATEAPETAQDMELETPNTAAEESTGDAVANGGEGEENSKRAREEEAEEESGGEKKQKTEKSAEEERFEKLDGGEESDRVGLGPKNFGSSVEIFDYFYKLLHYWPPNLNVNKVIYAKCLCFSLIVRLLS